MPRTSALDCPGIPPIRALTFDVLGLVKVIEAAPAGGGGGGNQGSSSIPKIVERWGEPDSSKCVLAASIDDRKFDPLLAVARKNGQIEVLNPLNGEIRASEAASSSKTDDPITGLHLFKKERLELSTRMCTLLTCTMKGNAILRSIEVGASLAESKCTTDSPKTWNVCTAGNVLCSAVDGNEKYALFGGKGVEINLWDLDTSDKIWTSKSPPKNSLDIFTPTWFTAATFLSKEDHRKIVTGTNSHEVRLYDISAKKRPVLSIDFREAAIKSVTEDLDGHTIYFGTGAGDLASVDMRTGKVLGCFLGKCSGSIRSIARHPEFPVVASCGLDSYLRFWDIKTRQLLSAVFLKQHLTSVVIDSNFSDKEPASAVVDPKPNEVLQMNQNLVVDDDELVHVKRKKKSSRERGENKKLKAKQMNQNQVEDDDDESVTVKRKKTSKEREENKKLKVKKMNQNQVEDDDDDDDELVPVKKKTSREREENKKLNLKKKSKKRVQHEDDE